jgi:hypothetical protein
LAGKPKYSEKTYPSTTLSTTNPTCLDPVLNPGRRDGKPAINRLSYGAGLFVLRSIASVDIRRCLCPENAKNLVGRGFDTFQSIISGLA